MFVHRVAATAPRTWRRTWASLSFCGGRGKEATEFLPSPQIGSYGPLTRDYRKDLTPLFSVSPESVPREHFLSIFPLLFESQLFLGREAWYGFGSVSVSSAMSARGDFFPESKTWGHLFARTAAFIPCLALVTLTANHQSTTPSEKAGHRVFTVAVG
jgi:hypothetical protein